MSEPALFAEVSDRPIDPSRVLARLACPAHGAQTLFLGVVREMNEGRKVVAVSYDAFPPLAEKTLLEICAEARASWGPDLATGVVHRTGRLEVGEASVAVVVGSPHRAAAYEASRYLIEQLKVRVPIWKKEHYQDGDARWLRGHPLAPAATSAEISGPGAAPKVAGGEPPEESSP